MSLEEFVVSNEKQIRMGFFFSVLVIMAIWEIARPRRKLTVSKPLRWINNLGLVFFNSYILRLLFPAAAIGVGAIPGSRRCEALSRATQGS